MTEVIAQELFRREQAEQESYVAEALAVRRLTEGAPESAPGEPTMAAATHHSVALVQIAGVDDQQAEVLLGAAAVRLRRGLAPRRSLALVEGARAVFVLAGTKAEIRSAAGRLLASARLELEQTAGAGVAIGVGGVRDSASELVESRREAELALRVARSATGHGPLAHWEDLEAYRLIAALIGTRDIGELLPGSLQALLADPDAQTLVPTVEAYLEHGGDAAATVGQLFIHRSSLYSRLHRVEKLAGIDMRSGADRLELHLGLRLWRLGQPGESGDA
jgi:sugar diacid utilization regulator